MNRKNHRLCTAVIAPALLALSLLTSGCVEPLDPSKRGSIDPNAVSLPIRLYIPGAMPATKAGYGDVSGVSPESQIYSIQVWMYDHATGTEATDNEQKPVSYAQAYLGWNQQNNLGKWDKSGYYASGQWTSDQIYELLFKIPNSVIESTRPMKFDFYVLANGTSIGSSGSPATPTMTRGELKALKFGYTSATVDPFGPYGPKTGTTPTNALGTSGPGLPISGFFNKTRNDDGTTGDATGVDLSFLRDKTKPASGDDPERPYTNDEIKAMSPVIQLERAVSKIRFAFARPQGLEGVQICKIEIDAGLIPQQTYVFPRETGNFLGVDTNDYPEDDYTAATKVMVPKNWTEAGSPLLATSAIKEVPDPTLLRSDCPTPTPADGGKDYSGKKPSEMTAQDYSLFLDDNTTSQILYLRESGKLITGKIYFKLTANGPVEEPATFTMTPKDEEDTYTHFYRNHSWNVYAYFEGGDLYVKPVVSDWIDAPELEYTMKMNTNMRLFDSWLYRYDTDGDYSNPDNWATSHMAVSSGRVTTATETEPIVGRPLRSPQIQLVTTGVAVASVTGSGTFDLKVDNSDFELVRANKNATTGKVTSYEASADGVLTIPAGDNVYTYFYIVPKVSVTPSNPPSNPEAKVTLIYHDAVLGPQKVTFNYNALPGYSDDSSEIWAYYFPENQYNITGKLKMYYQDSNNPLVPTPVQN